MYNPKRYDFKVAYDGWDVSRTPDWWMPKEDDEE